MSHPEIALSRDPPDREPRRPAGVMAAKRLQVVATADDLARLRVLAHGVIVVDLVLGILIARGGRGPMPIDGFPDVLLIHHRLHSGPLVSVTDA